MSPQTPLKVGITMGDPDGVGPEVIRAAIDRLGRRAQHVAWSLYGLERAFEGVDGEVHLATGERPERDAV